MNTKIEATRESVITAWNKTDDRGKMLLEDLYGKSTFEQQDICDRMKTIDDAYRITNKVRIDFSFLPEGIRDYHAALQDAITIAEALNEGWFPDWENDDEPKWRPYFWMSPSGFAFLDSFCFCAAASAGSGSRLHFKSEELATYAAKQFPGVWKIVQLG